MKRAYRKRLRKRLRIWLQDKKEELKEGTWTVKQNHKKSGEGYMVGKVVDFVYSYEHPEYIHMILKIKVDRKGWGGRGYVYKLTYMTTDAKNTRVTNGQRPPVMGAGCYYSLMRKAEKHNFF